MIFLLISQRAISNPNYSLKDLTGHGRIDVVMRSILAAIRPLATDKGHRVMAYLKGGKDTGWLDLQPDRKYLEIDEVGLAALIQENWNDLFISGSIDDLIKSLSINDVILLDEMGEDLNSQIIKPDSLIVLGAQADLTAVDLESLSITKSISLGNRSLLSSQAIIYLRQKLF